MTTETRTINVIIDPDAPTAGIERAVLRVQEARAKLAEAQAELAEAQESLARFTAASQVTIDAVTKPSDGKPTRSGGNRLPNGKNLAALKIVAEEGDTAKAAVAVCLYGVDDRGTRLKVYNKFRHWKDKGWLVKQADGTRIVAPGLIEEAEAAETA